MSSPEPTNPVAVVTGSGRTRIGNLIARDLANAGYRIAIHYRQSHQAAEKTVADICSARGIASAYPADLSEEQEVDRLFEHVATNFQRLDVLVNAASVWSPKSLEKVTAADVYDNFRVNTLATFLCCRRAGLMMSLQETGGSIINIGDARMDRPLADYSAYLTSKGSIPTLTRSMAVELASRNPRVRVNAILPGSVMAPPEATEVEQQRRRDATLVKSADLPHTVCHTVRYLIDNEFVNGTCVMLDGGRALLGP